jgi:hypothetical protein
MPTLLQMYSSHQTNKLVTRTIEYTVKQFYLMNRKPFILQMFGSVSSILDIDEVNQFGHTHEVSEPLNFFPYASHRPKITRVSLDRWRPVACSNSSSAWRLRL